MSTNHKRPTTPFAGPTSEPSVHVELPDGTGLSFDRRDFLRIGAAASAAAPFNEEEMAKARQLHVKDFSPA